MPDPTKNVNAKSCSTYLGQQNKECLQKQVRAVLTLHGFRLVLKIHEAGLHLVPHWEIVYVVQGHEEIEHEDENLQVH